MTQYIYQPILASTYGSGTYNNSDYNGSTTSGTGTSGSGSGLVNTGIAVTAIVTVACMIIFVALIVRWAGRSKKKQQALAAQEVDSDSDEGQTSDQQ